MKHHLRLTVTIPRKSYIFLIYHNRQIRPNYLTVLFLSHDPHRDFNPTAHVRLRIFYSLQTYCTYSFIKDNPILLQASISFLGHLLVPFSRTRRNVPGFRWKNVRVSLLVAVVR